MCFSSTGSDAPHSAWKRFQCSGNQNGSRNGRNSTSDAADAEAIDNKVNVNVYLCLIFVSALFSGKEKNGRGEGSPDGLGGGKRKFQMDKVEGKAIATFLTFLC